MTLDDPGRRICIMGPSNSGKSTLAAAVGRARGLMPVHLDQLYHRSDTDWQPRPDGEFIKLHDEVILRDNWVMDGNYSRSLPQRLARATVYILLDASTTISLLRYLRRSWYERDRPGNLEGGGYRVKWAMILHIAATTRANRRRYAGMFDQFSLPKIKLATSRELARLYLLEGISR